MPEIHFLVSSYWTCRYCLHHSLPRLSAGKQPGEFKGASNQHFYRVRHSCEVKTLASAFSGLFWLLSHIKQWDSPHSHACYSWAWGEQSRVLFNDAQHVSVCERVCGGQSQPRRHQNRGGERQKPLDLIANGQLWKWTGSGRVTLNFSRCLMFLNSNLHRFAMTCPLGIEKPA